MDGWATGRRCRRDRPTMAPPDTPRGSCRYERALPMRWSYSQLHVKNQSSRFHKLSSHVSPVDISAAFQSVVLSFFFCFFLFWGLRVSSF
ncbi:unnamed protein product [Ixodes pacificus]